LPNHNPILTRSASVYLHTTEDRSDEELIRAAQSNPQAFDVLFRRYVERIYAYMYSFTHDVKEAEDLTSQTFLSAWKGLGRYQEQGTFSAWLFRIARNKAHDLHRTKHYNLPLEAAGKLQVDWDPAAGIEKKDTIRRLALLIETLEPDQIELLSLRFGAGLSYAEIGSVLRRSDDAIKMAFHRLFQKLRSEWKVYDE
jgi:RNA polymerase sigma-70 factor, ECF subfamily